MHIVEVSGASPYSCVIGSGALSRLRENLAGAKQVAIIFPATMPGLAAIVHETLKGAGVRVRVIPVPAGEQAKTPQVLTECWRALAKDSFTRSDLIIGIGGGATTDLAGLVAATWLRGIDFIAIPSTVLGMVDAAIGGKTGIDLPEGKNLVGAFHEPRVVLADFDLLAGLPAREVAAGLAEVVKAGFVQVGKIEELIRDNPGEALDVTSTRFADLVQLAIDFKARIVAEDFRENTSVGSQIGRELLNYGHTMAHAIEAYEQFGLRHGEAVSLGMVYIALLAEQVLGLDSQVVQAHRELLASLGLPIRYSSGPYDALRTLMGRDKKNRGQELRFVALAGPRSATMLVCPPEDQLVLAYRRLGE